MNLRLITAGLVAMVLALAITTDATNAAPPLQLPWPAGHQHRISGGNTYNCGTHTTDPATSGTAYNADYYAIDFQFGSVDGSPLDIAATAGGVVVYRDDAGDGYGNKVVLDHVGGYYSVYAHLRASNTWGPGIVVGAAVAQGQLLGYAGSTGGPYAVHLHFHMQLNLAAYKPEPMSGVAGFGSYGACTGITSPYWTAWPPSIVCDFNGDGREDAAIGVPEEDIGSMVDAGAANEIAGR